MNIEQVLAQAEQLLAAWNKETIHPESNRLDVVIVADDLRAAVIALHDAHWGYLSAITGLDLGTASAQLEALYHFCNGPAVASLRVRLPRDQAILPSSVEALPSWDRLEVDGEKGSAVSHPQPVAGLAVWALPDHFLVWFICGPSLVANVRQMLQERRHATERLRFHHAPGLGLRAGEQRADHRRAERDRAFLHCLVSSGRVLQVNPQAGHSWPQPPSCIRPWPFGHMPLRIR